MHLPSVTTPSIRRSARTNNLTPLKSARYKTGFRTRDEVAHNHSPCLFNFFFRLALHPRAQRSAIPILAWRRNAGRTCFRLGTSFSGSFTKSSRPQGAFPGIEWFAIHRGIFGHRSPHRAGETHEGYAQFMEKSALGGVFY